MPAVRVLPEPDRVEVGREPVQALPRLRVTEHRLEAGQPAVQPQEVTQRIVLGVRPPLVHLGQSLPIEPDVRTVHRIRRIRATLGDRAEAGPLRPEEVQEGLGGPNSGGHVPGGVKRVGHMDVVPHPAVLIPGAVPTPGQPGGRKQPGGTGRKPEGPAAEEQFADRVEFLEGILGTEQRLESAVASGIPFTLRMADGREYAVPEG